MKNQNSIVGIDLGAEKIRVAYFDNTCIEPLIITVIDGYGSLSENNIEELFFRLKEKIGKTEAVVAVPAYFNCLQRKMIRNVATKAEISIKRLFNKTSSAAMAFEYDRVYKKQEDKQDKIVAVCSLDGGILEIALAEIGEGVIETFAIDWEKDFNTDNMDTNRFSELCRRIITEINITSKDIDTVILACESHHIPFVRPLISDFFHINPDDIIIAESAVVIGASIHGAILYGNIKDILLLDVISISLGIETSGGIMTKIVRRNTTIQTRKSLIFPVSSSSPFPVIISVFQGENEIASENCYLGTFSLQNMKPLSKKGSIIEVTIDIDPDVLVHVSAKDLESGNKIKIRI